MNIVYKYISSIIMVILRRLWYTIKMHILKEQLEKEKQEAENAVKKADDDYNDFIADMELRKRENNNKNKPDRGGGGE